MIEERNIVITERRIISPARYEDVETGEFYEVTRINESGDQVIEKNRIYKRVFIEAQYEEHQTSKVQYVVADGNEEHLFSTYDDAKSFDNGR